jgi:GGDEF domain-containing protein
VQTAIEEVDAVEALAGRLLGVMRPPFAAAEGAPPLTMSASIGTALYPEDGTEPASLIEAADRALYAAKSGGGRRHVRAGGSRAAGHGAAGDGAGGIDGEAAPPG